jgi:hypothetical protein
MCHSKDGWFQPQFSFLKRQFLQEGDLPFTDILSEDGISEALTAINAPWNDRIFPPLVTLWVFLVQILSADHSCRAAGRLPMNSPTASTRKPAKRWRAPTTVCCSRQFDWLPVGRIYAADFSQ